MVVVNTKNVRKKKEIQKQVTKNYLELADSLVRRNGPVKTYGRFCELTGLNKSNLTYVRGGLRMIPIECAIIACDIFGVSYDWMISNKGEMLDQKMSEKVALSLKERVEKMEKLLKAKLK